MAVASVRPILAQGAQGSAGFSRRVWRSLEPPWTLPWDLEEKELQRGRGLRAEGEGGQLGGVPGDQITAPRGRRLGGRIPLPSPPLPWRVLCLATITDTPTLGTPLGSPPQWQAPAPPRHPPQ